MRLGADLKRAHRPAPGGLEAVDRREELALLVLQERLDSCQSRGIRILKIARTTPWCGKRRGFRRQTLETCFQSKTLHIYSNITNKDRYVW